jgi:hypothetical protein
MRSTFSTPLAADNGVSGSTLLSGKYLTFSSVLVISAAYLILATGQGRGRQVDSGMTTGDETMTVELPRPLADYFAAKNRHDIDGMLIAFIPDATVRDEGETHHGSAAIRDWMETTTRKYRVVVEVTKASASADVWRIAGVVSGNFPGSPATLHYDFTLAGERIARLEIGA